MNDQEKALVKTLVDALEGMQPRSYEVPIEGSDCFRIENAPAHFGECSRIDLEAGKRYIASGELPTIPSPRILGVIRCPECNHSKESWQDSDGTSYRQGLRNHLMASHGYTKKAANRTTNETHSRAGRV